MSHYDDAPERRNDDAQEVFSSATATYDYVDERGLLIFQVGRDARKRFRQRRPIVGADPKEGNWAYETKSVRRVLYKLPEVAVAVEERCRVYIAEGEKDADNVGKLGLIATTAPMGAKAPWEPAYTKQIAGCHDVIVLQDSDEPGRAHAKKVAEALHGQVERVRILPLPAHDVSDWIEAGGTRDALEALADGATAFTPPDERFTSIVLSAPDFVAKEYPKPRNLLGDGILCAGDLGILYGKPGTAKTWAALQLALSLTRSTQWLGFQTGNGVPLRVGFLELELHAKRAQERLIALGVTPNDHGLRLISRPDLTGRVDLLSNDDCKALERWCRDDGLDLVILDALSRIHSADENMTGPMGDVLGKLDEIRHNTGTAPLIIHHEPKTTGGQRGPVSDLDALRGSSRLQSDPTFLMRLVKLPSGVRTLRFVKCSNAGEPEPIFLRQRDDGILEVTDPPEKKGTENRAKVLAALKKLPNGAKSKAIAEAAGLCESATGGHLAALEGEGKARRVGTGKATVWQPGEAA